MELDGTGATQHHHEVCFRDDALPVAAGGTALGHLSREEDGATEFWRLKDCLRNDLVRSRHWSDELRISMLY